MNANMHCRAGAYLRVSLGTAVALLAVVFWDVEPAAGQDRRSLRTPGLVLETGAPTAATHQMLFTRDGKYLLAAGDDKVVRQWPVNENGTLDRDNLQFFRWAIHREQRGSIYSIALSPDAKQRLLAISGFGLRNGSISLIDRTNGTVVAGLTQPGQGDVITRMAFSPDARQIAFGTIRGELYVWSPQDRANQVRRLGDHGAEAGSTRALAWPEADTIVSVVESGVLRQWNPRGDRALSRSVSLQLEKVDGADIATNGDVVVAVGQRIVEGRRRFLMQSISLSDGKQSVKALPEGTASYTITLSPDARRAVMGIGPEPTSSQANATAQYELRIYDLVADRSVRAKLPTITAEAQCFVFSPDEKRLVVAGGQSHELQVWDLAQEALVEKISSPGATMWQVAMSADGQRIGFRQQRSRSPRSFNALGAGDWQVFNLQRRSRIETVGEGGFQAALPRESRTWEVQPDPHNHQRWFVHHRASGKRYLLPLDSSKDGSPHCYTFLNLTTAGREKLVVGHRFGMSVFELAPTKEPRLVRKYTGHQGNVISVAPSADGTQLISGSSDQTISVWSLADWPKPNHPEIGAAFELRNGELAVRSVASGSPAWEAGLTPGDVVVRFAYDEKEYRGNPAQWLQIINTSTPGLELYFEVRREGEAKPVPMLTTVRQRPVWRFFATTDREWVMWRWRDFYYDCSVRGDNYIGWQVSTDVDETPRFIRAEENRARFHSPKKLDEVLSALSGPGVNLEKIVEAELVPPAVSLELEEQADGSYLATIEAKASDLTSLSDPMEVTLWINDHKFRQWKRPPLPFKHTERIGAASFRRGKNHIFCQAYSQYAVRADSQEAIVHLDVPQRPRKLLGLCIGIADYPSKADLGPLLFPAMDALAVQKALQRQQRSTEFDSVVIQTLVDGEVTREEILRRMKEFAQIAQPDDQFVLYMSGHGWAKTTGPISTQPQTFTFVLPQFNEENYLETGLPFCLPPSSRESGQDTLYEMLAKLPCHKVVLLDCCHSGGSTHMIRDLTPDGDTVGPIIMVACDKDELAWEIIAVGHGAFTSALLDALSDKFVAADTDRDSRLDVDELRRHLVAAVPDLIDVFRRLLEPSLMEMRGSDPSVELRLPIHQTPQVFMPRRVQQTALFAAPRALGPGE